MNILCNLPHYEQFRHKTKFFRNSSNQNIFPPTVKLLSLEMWTSQQVLVRLENMGLQHTESVSLSPLLAMMGQVGGAEERSLDGNININHMQRLTWNTRGQRKPRTAQTAIDIDDIQLKPKQIRTFVIDLV